MTSISTLNYVEPEWSRLPLFDKKYHLKVIKDKILIDDCELVEKSYFSLGRLPLCDVEMEHSSISRFHAIIQFGIMDKKIGIQAFIYDLKSVHGTFINKERIQSERYYPILSGSVLNFGASTRDYIFIIFSEKDQISISSPSLKDDYKILNERISILKQYFKEDKLSLKLSDHGRIVDEDKMKKNKAILQLIRNSEDQDIELELEAFGDTEIDAKINVVDLAIQQLIREDYARSSSEDEYLDETLSSKRKNKSSQIYTLDLLKEKESLLISQLKGLEGLDKFEEFTSSNNNQCDEDSLDKFMADSWKKQKDTDCKFIEQEKQKIMKELSKVILLLNEHS